MKKYFNYHRHSYSSNVSTIDCTVSNEDYAKRSIELGHKWLSSCEHGGVVNWVDAYMTAQKHKLKYIHVGEYYFVENRDVVEVKDKSNYHLILIAKNRKGFEEMNYIMSEANSSGYYYKPRIDLELLRGLPKDSVWVTSACVGGFLRDYPKTKPILDELVNIFGDNLLLEVQPHTTEKQIEYNKLMKELSKEYGLKLVGACDSHMIEEKGVKDRDYLLHSKGLIYEDEEGWFLDFPSYDTLFGRFMSQGIWAEEEVGEFLRNTLLLTESDDIVIDTKMKVPTIFSDKSRGWKLGHLKQLIWSKWSEYKEESCFNYDEANKYICELTEEFNIIEQTKLEDYFLTNYYIIKKGIENGGILTPTGRGSATSFLINFMLGFTTVDRLKAKVPMLRDRFIGIARILENNSCADIDFNVHNRDAFIKAQDELLGESCNYFMSAYGTLKLKSAFKMLCRAYDIDIDIANEISKIISTYEYDKKHNESVKIEDYVKDVDHLNLINDSKKYMGIIDSFSAHPCSFILSNKDIRREFGIMKSPSGDLVANITGSQAESLGYLKNDLLVVTVVGMNDKLYKRIGIKIPTSTKLCELVEGDYKVWDLYGKGFTMCLNQMESTGTTQKAMRYKPLSVEELCNLIAIIRPACKSIYPMFEKRQIFEYGIKDLDELLQGEFLESSFIIYQEQIMLLFKWLGFPESDGYAIMKAISKKKLDVIESVKQRFENILIEAMIKDMLKQQELKNDK